MTRLPALDRLRGLVIALMAVDHANAFIAGKHSSEFWGVPLPAYAGALPFLTRWITHLAAPGFFFLLGVGVVFLASARREAGWEQGRIFRHLAVRGALLILAQHLIENPAWIIGQTIKVGAQLSVIPGTATNVWIHFGVLNALGWALILSAPLVRLRPWANALLGAALIGGTLLVLPSADAAMDPVEWGMRYLFVPGRTGMMQVYYPILPWWGVAALGVAFGQLLREDPAKGLRLALPLGAAALLLFVVTRMTGIGAVHGIESPGWIGFLNVTKYPPDLPFLAVTLGLVLLLLWGLARAPAAPLTRWLEVFGGTALFFYFLHLYIYLLLGVGFRQGTGYGMLYAGWGAGLVILYFACRWYRDFKRGTAVDSVWRFL